MTAINKDPHIMRALPLFFLACLLLSCASPQKEGSASPKPGSKTAVQARPPAIGALAPGEPSTRVPVEGDDIVVGSPTADVTLVAFLDFECPYCIEGFSSIQELRKIYPESVLRVVLKQHPLQSHEAAIPAAVAAQAVQVGAGGKAAFAYATLLFEGRDLSFGGLADAAEKVGLSRERYVELVESEETVHRVVTDLKLAAQLGIRGTPAFFVNGKMLAGLTELDTFQAVMDEELAAMKELRKHAPFAKAYAERVDTNAKKSLIEALLAADPGLYRVPVDGSPIDGPKDAPVTLVVFSDFECPFCERAEKTVRSLRSRYQDNLRVVFKHAPLPFHPHAPGAARLATLAQVRKGDVAFYQAADLLFRTRAKLGPNAFLEIGGALGLAEDEVERATLGEIPEVEARLAQDADLAEDVEVRGTPHFFINGRRLVGAQPEGTFEALIDYELGLARGELARGTAPNDLYTRLQRDAVSPGAPQTVEKVVPSDKSPMRGAKNPKVFIHVWSDFQCPYCRKAEGLLKELEATHGSEFAIVWHDLPLDFHKRALPAARAAREAYRQKGSSGFWAMHHLLFGLDASVPLIDESEIEAHAKELKLNVKGLTEALSGARDETIVFDQELARDLGIEGTPAFFIVPAGQSSGYLIKGMAPLHKFERILSLATSSDQAPK